MISSLVLSCIKFFFYIEPWSQRLALSSTPSFLRLTSFSAVCSENEVSLKQYEPITALRLPQLNPPGALNVVLAVDGRQIQLVAELLSLPFDDFALYRRTAIT
jgi:hypothetical protein